SWGNDWGENGFFRVSWDDTLDIGHQTWAFETPQLDGYVTVRRPHGRVFVSGVTQLQAESTFPQTKKIDLVLSNAAEHPILTSTCESTPCATTLDTKTLSNGKYEVYAIVHWGDGKTTLSQHEQIFVFNGKPSLKLSFTPIPGENIDLAHPPEHPPAHP